MSNNVCFVIETQFVRDGKKLVGLKPDKDGVFRRFPLAIMNAASRNNTYYDYTSMSNAMQNPRSRFYVSLTEGALKGEYGHPMVGPQDLERMLSIDLTRVSHHFTKISVEPSSDGSFYVVYGDFKPDGPYGELLRASMEDKYKNDSFSLRSLFRPIRKDGQVEVRETLVMVTFDYVDVPGFNQASKINCSSASETLIPIKINDLLKVDNINEYFGMEHFDRQELLDVLQTNKVMLNHRVVGCYYDNDSNCIVDSNQMRHSVFHSYFKRS
jgi:hypothetical protein